MSADKVPTTEPTATAPEDTKPKKKHSRFRSIALKLRHRKEKEVMEQGISGENKEELRDFFDKPAPKVDAAAAAAEH
jgi:hypothetical protein